MGKYIKLFEEHVDYMEYISSQDAILPNVSACIDANDVHYNPYVDPYNGHEYVEIGGVKWATMNLGATSVTDTGLYFQWGDTQGYTAAQVGNGEGQKYFGWADYKYSDNGGSSVADMTKYNSVDEKTVLDAEDDAVQAAWGGNWRMPTTEEFQALASAVNAVWTSDYEGSGVKGLVCTDKTDSTKVLFLPAGGQCYSGWVGDTNSSGYYHTKSLSVICTDSYSVSVRSNPNWSNTNPRHNGRTIRGIFDDNNI